MHSRSRRITFVLPAALAVLSLPATQIMGQSALELAPSLSSPDLRQQVQGAIELFEKGTGVKRESLRTALPLYLGTTFQANDVGVGAKGHVWFIHTDGTSIYRITDSVVKKVSGGASRIDVDPNGNAWVVNAGGQIWRWMGSDWQLMPGGAATDIGVGANGTVWVIGAGGALFRWDQATSKWVQLPTGGGTRIAVDPAGNPWVVNASNQIWRYTGTAWQQLPGAARDIGIAKSADGTVYVISTRQATGGFACDRWDSTKNNWAAETSCAGIGIGAGPTGMVYAARGAGYDALTRNLLQ